MFEVSNAVAHANTLPEMNLAFESLFTLMALPDDSVKRDIWIQFAEPQLESGAAQRPTFEETYGSLDEQMRSDPRTSLHALSLTAQQFLDVINPRLPAAYASPNSPFNSPYVLFSSTPGHIPGSAPILSLATRMDLFQTVLLTELYGRIYAELNPVEVPAPLDSQPSHQSMGGGSDECKAACQAVFGACDQTCADTFGEDLRRAGARFRAEAGPELILLVGSIVAITALSDTLIHACGDSQGCIDGVYALFADVLTLLYQNYNQALSIFTGGYYTEVESAQNEFGSCRHSCNQSLAACLVDCHNQGGG